MLTLILSPLRKAAGLALAGLLAFLAIWGLAKRQARQETALQAAERIAKAEIKRGRIEDEIDQDTDLVRRAHASGVVRHTEH
jgi:hypothetical protein